MPKIEQLDWSKLKPATINTSTHFSGTKNFATYEYKEPSKKSKHGAIKITRPPKPQKKKKVKSIDKTLWRENFDQMQHLHNISREI